MQFKYVLTTETDPYRNLAMEQLLFQYVKNGQTILYLWQNDHVIVIGKNQNPYAECRAEEFLRDSGRIARRKSGGGAVYHDLGNLNFSIISTSKETEQVQYQTIIKKALDAYGVSIDFNGRNDLVWNEKKFSGNACYDNGKVCCQHGTLLVHTDIEKMTYYLTPEASKLERNHVKSVSSRVVNLEEADTRITIEDLKRKMVEATKAEELLFDIDDEDFQKQTEFFGSKEWIFGGAK